MRLVAALDRHRRVTAVPFQQPGAPEAAGLSVTQCESAAWAVLADGRRFRGAGAINAVLGVALGTWLPVQISTVPGIRRLQDAVYAWVAHHRGWLPGVTPFCERYPKRCR